MSGSPTTRRLPRDRADHALRSDHRVRGASRRGSSRSSSDRPPAPMAASGSAPTRPRRIAVERISPRGESPGCRGSRPAHAVSARSSPPTGTSGSGSNATAPAVKTYRVGGPTAIARMTPAGKVTEFTRCLRTLPEFAGPEGLTEGPEGDIWFNTRISGESAHPNPPRRPRSAASPRTGRSPNFATAWTSNPNPTASPSPAAGSGSSTAGSTRSAS